MPPRRKTPEPPGLPPISFEEGKRRIVIHINKGEELLNKRPIGEIIYQTWTTGAADTIERVYGQYSDWLSTFEGQRRISMATHPGEERYLEPERAEKIQQRI